MDIDCVNYTHNRCYNKVKIGLLVKCDRNEPKWVYELLCSFFENVTLCLKNFKQFKSPFVFRKDTFFKNFKLRFKRENSLQNN